MTECYDAWDGYSGLTKTVEEQAKEFLDSAVGSPPPNGPWKDKTDRIIIYLDENWNQIYAVSLLNSNYLTRHRYILDHLHNFYGDFNEWIISFYLLKRFILPPTYYAGLYLICTAILLYGLHLLYLATGFGSLIIPAATVVMSYVLFILYLMEKH